MYQGHYTSTPCAASMGINSLLDWRCPSPPTPFTLSLLRSRTCPLAGLEPHELTALCPSSMYPHAPIHAHVMGGGVTHLPPAES